MSRGPLPIRRASAISDFSRTIITYSCRGSVCIESRTLEKGLHIQDFLSLRRKTVGETGKCRPSQRTPRRLFEMHVDSNTGRHEINKNKTVQWDSRKHRNKKKTKTIIGAWALRWTYICTAVRHTVVVAAAYIIHKRKHISRYPVTMLCTKKKKKPREIVPSCCVEIESWNKKVLYNMCS